MATGQAAKKKTVKKKGIAVTIDKEKIKDATVINLTPKDAKGKNRVFVVIEKIDREWAAKMGWPACCNGPLLYYRRR